MRGRIPAGIFVGVAVQASAPALTMAEQHMMQPRVSSDKLAEARALTSPLPDSPETVEKGKAFYDGKGTCCNCHG